MSDPSHELQRAVYAALSGSSGLLALLGGQARIYDKTPPNAVYPFLRIGDDQVIDDRTSCDEAWEAFVTVHVFSRAAAPRPEVKAILAQAKAALDAPGPALTGFLVTVAELRDSRTYFETDQTTAHGVLTMRYLIDPA